MVVLHHIVPLISSVSNQAAWSNTNTHCHQRKSEKVKVYTCYCILTYFLHYEFLINSMTFEKNSLNHVSDAFSQIYLNLNIFLHA